MLSQQKHGHFSHSSPLGLALAIMLNETARQIKREDLLMKLSNTSTTCVLPHRGRDCLTVVVCLFIKRLRVGMRRCCCVLSVSIFSRRTTAVLHYFTCLLPVFSFFLYPFAIYGVDL